MTCFVLNFLGSQWFLLDDHPQSKESHQEPVTSITKHHGEKERETDDGELGRIHFAVRSHTVSINQSLETDSELIGAIERRWYLTGRHPIQNGGHGASTSFLFTKNNS